MNEGAVLYVDVWDDIGLLSAWVYKSIDFAFGRSNLSFQIIGLILFFFQIFYINYVALKHKMYNENNYLPAFFYGIFGLIFFNVVTLSPQMIGLTFILFSINNLFNHVESRNKTDGNLLNIGLYVGIASLFYLPLFIFILVHIVGLLFFTNTIRRRYLLLLYGFSVPLIIGWIMYAWQGEAGSLFSNNFYSLFDQSSNLYLSSKSILILSGSTIIIFIIASFKTLTGFGFTVFQVRIQKVMFFGSLMALIVNLLYSNNDGYSLILFFPWFAFFITHLFLKIKNSLKRELSFLVYLLTVIVIYLGLTFHMFNFDSIVDYSSLMVLKSTAEPEYLDKKILVLGPDIRPYALAHQATPYFNWNLSKGQLSNLDFYDNLEAVHENMRKDMPEYIIDQIGLAPKLFEQIPLIGREYTDTGKGIYKRITSSN